MKNFWKWLLGILIVLALLSIPFALHYTFGNSFPRGFGMRFQMMGDGGWNHPGLQDMHRGLDNPHGFNGGFGMHGFGFFGPIIFLGGLVKLFLFGALLYAAYWLGRRNARLALDPAPVAPAASVVEPTPEEDPAPDGKGKRKAKKGE
jgi:hypothetical protein